MSLEGLLEHFGAAPLVLFLHPQVHHAPVLILGEGQWFGVPLVGVFGCSSVARSSSSSGSPCVGGGGGGWMPRMLLGLRFGFTGHRVSALTSAPASTRGGFLSAGAARGLVGGGGRATFLGAALVMIAIPGRGVVFYRRGAAVGWGGPVPVAAVPLLVVAPPALAAALPDSRRVVPDLVLLGGGGVRLRLGLLERLLMLLGEFLASPHVLVSMFLVVLPKRGHH